MVHTTIRRSHRPARLLLRAGEPGESVRAARPGSRDPAAHQRSADPGQSVRALPGRHAHRHGVRLRKSLR